jgi:hypothetical protein
MAVAGAWIAIAFDRRKSTNQELIMKRLAVYEIVAPRANDLLCYFLCIGNWKALTPDILISHKREMDRQAYIYGSLFSADTIRAYHRFIHACFKTYVGSGMAAQLRADVDYVRGEWQSSWQMAWEAAFVERKDAVGGRELRMSYEGLLAALATEIGARR